MAWRPPRPATSGLSRYSAGQHTCWSRLYRHVAVGSSRAHHRHHRTCRCPCLPPAHRSRPAGDNRQHPRRLQRRASRGGHSTKLTFHWSAASAGRRQAERANICRVGRKSGGAKDARQSTAVDESRKVCIVIAVKTVVQRDALARFGYALSDTTRASILLSLREGGRYPSDLADYLGVSRQIVSNHLACLRGCGLVVVVPHGRRSLYELADPRIAHALTDLVGLVLAVDPACCTSSAHDGCC
jgi:ArsR family transcriptional regulator, cadmium/lead-responsive transcriptional repressor